MKLLVILFILKLYARLNIFNHNHVFKNFFYHAINLPHIKQFWKNKKYNKTNKQDPKLIKSHLSLLRSPVRIKGKEEILAISTIAIV